MLTLIYLWASRWAIGVSDGTPVSLGVHQDRSEAYGRIGSESR